MSALPVVCIKEEKQEVIRFLWSKRVNSSNMAPSDSFLSAVQGSFAKSLIFLRRRGVGSGAKVAWQPTENFRFGTKKQAVERLDQMHRKRRNYVEK